MGKAFGKQELDGRTFFISEPTRQPPLLHGRSYVKGRKMSRDRTAWTSKMAVTAPGSDLWVGYLVRQKALEQTQKVPPQAQKVPLTVALTTAMTPWERH